jgi:hypothetical protein
MEMRSAVIGFLLCSDSKRLSICLAHDEIVGFQKPLDYVCGEELNVEVADEQLDKTFRAELSVDLEHVEQDVEFRVDRDQEVAEDEKVVIWLGYNRREKPMN